MFTLAKSYRFAAAHTLRSPKLSEGENRSVYGKCANPSGHGHDYTLEFRLSIDRLADDVVYGRGILDQLIAEHVAPHVDRTDVNQTLGSGFISSGENLAVWAHRLIAPHLPAGLMLAVRLTETDKNSFVFRDE